jgi:hypothetical protein
MNTNQYNTFNQNIYHRNRIRVHCNMYMTRVSTENTLSTVSIPPLVVRCRDLHTPVENTCVFVAERTSENLLARFVSEFGPFCFPFFSNLSLCCFSAGELLTISAR